MVYDVSREKNKDLKELYYNIMIITNKLKMPRAPIKIYTVIMYKVKR